MGNSDMTLLYQLCLIFTVCICSFINSISQKFQWNLSVVATHEINIFDHSRQVAAQVHLCRISVTGTSSSRHDREVAALNGDHYSQPCSQAFSQILSRSHFAHGCEIKSGGMRLKVTIVKTYGTVVMKLQQCKQDLMDYTLTLN